MSLNKGFETGSPSSTLNFYLIVLIVVFFSRPMNPPPVGAWRGSDDNGYISAEPSPGAFHLVRRANKHLQLMQALRGLNQLHTIGLNDLLNLKCTSALCCILLFRLNHHLLFLVTVLTIGFIVNNRFPYEL